MSHTAAAGARRPIAIAPTRPDLIDAAFVLVLCALGLIGFHTSYDGPEYLVVGLVGVVLGIVLAHAVRVAHWPWITGLLLAIVAYFLFGTALAVRNQAVAVVLPSADSLHTLASTTIHGWKQLLTTLPPVARSGPLLLIPYILGLLGGAGGFTLARRVTDAAAAAVAPALVLVGVILLGSTHPREQVLQSAAFAIVALVWTALRAARARPPLHSGTARRTQAATAVVLVGLSAVAAGYLGPHLPGVGRHRTVLRNYVTPPFDLAAYPSPLVGYRKFTKDANDLADADLFTVTGLPADDYVQIATLDTYNGTVWAATQSSGATAGDAQDSFQRVGPRIDTGAKGPAATVTITVAASYAASDDLNEWLPTTGAATGVTFTGSGAADHTSQFRYNLATSTGIVPDRLRTGDRYTLHTVLGPDDLAQQPLPAGSAEPYGSPTLDSAVDAFTANEAAQWAKGSNGDVAQALAIAKRLATTGAYSDGGKGEGEYLPGHSQFRLQNFLSGPQPVGDDEQYAAAFALMANAVGVPARVVLGAQPEAGTGVVQGKDVHTWVQLHLSDGSWVSIPHEDFMPKTTTPPNTPPQEQQQIAKAAIVPPPDAVRSPSTLDQANQANARTSRTDNKPPAAPPKHDGGFTVPAWVTAALLYGGPPIAFLVLVALMIVVVKAVRRHRRRTRGSPAQRVSHGWRELVDHARDLGSEVPGGRTRREESVLLAPLGITPLAAAADATVFGPDQPVDDNVTGYWTQVDGARRSMSRQVGRWRRLRAAISLRSFRSRPTETRPA